MTGACTLNQVTKSIVLPLGQHYYTMPQFTLPTGTSPYTIYFRHGVLNGISNHHFYSNLYATGSVNIVFSARYQPPSSTLLDYWWGSDMYSTVYISTAMVGSLSAFT